MVLTTTQQEKIVRLRAKSTKLNEELKNVTITNVILTPTKDLEISNINVDIVSYTNHAGMTRVEYIAIVQPLKDKRGNLILQNKVIKSENNVLKKATQQQYEADRAIIQQQINDNETELINAIKAVNLSKMMHI